MPIATFMPPAKFIPTLTFIGASTDRQRTNPERGAVGLALIGFVPGSKPKFVHKLLILQWLFG